MCGARPLYLSAADAAGVQLVTGDTKVVDRGKGDGVFIATAGIGAVSHNLTIAPASVRPGDAVLLSGNIGRHGIAIMAVREGLQFEGTIESDCAPTRWVPRPPASARWRRMARSS